MDRLALVAMTTFLCLSMAAWEAMAGELDRTVRQWSTVEWSLAGSAAKGNPFDVEATAEFACADTGAKRTTGLFHAGDSTWKFRFAAVTPGRWTFVTASADDPKLKGQRGSVTVEANPDGWGFVVAAGDKWARVVGREDNLVAFAPQLVMYATPDRYHDKPDKIDADIRTFLGRGGFNGFHTYVFCRWFDLRTDNSRQIKSADPNPDPRTFEALELLINKTHAAGGVVHIWAWGDESRRQTPIRWGINGTADLRLQRYIAARLGPVPGWTMGYGYDLWEWVKGEQLLKWHQHMHRRLGWRHLLGARSQKNALTQLCEELDYSSYEQHRPDYAKYVETIAKRPGKPSFSEDRFRIRQGGGYAYKDYDELMTRRGLYHSTMAGGVANIWGRLDGQGSELGSKPYEHPEWIKTWSEFFRGRFLIDMVREKDLSDAPCLRSPDGSQLLLYKEDCDQVALDLSEAVPAGAAVAVDCLGAYREIDLGPLDAKAQTIKLPRKSDWAIAIGPFPARKP